MGLLVCVYALERGNVGLQLTRVEHLELQHQREDADHVVHGPQHHHKRHRNPGVEEVLVLHVKDNGDENHQRKHQEDLLVLNLYQAVLAYGPYEQPIAHGVDHGHAQKVERQEKGA